MGRSSRRGWRPSSSGRPHCGWPVLAEANRTSMTFHAAARPSALAKSEPVRGPALVLVDSSVWIDHLRSSNPQLEKLLLASQAAIHPFVIGELACGNLANRANRLYLLKLLPQAKVASEEEVLFFIERHGIAGKQIGYLDAHLLASAALSNTKIWTRDKRLDQVAGSLGLSA